MLFPRRNFRGRVAAAPRPRRGYSVEMAVSDVSEKKISTRPPYDERGDARLALVVGVDHGRRGRRRGRGLGAEAARGGDDLRDLEGPRDRLGPASNEGSRRRRGGVGGVAAALGRVFGVATKASRKKSRRGAADCFVSLSRSVVTSATLKLRPMPSKTSNAFDAASTDASPLANASTTASPHVSPNSTSAPSAKAVRSMCARRSRAPASAKMASTRTFLAAAPGLRMPLTTAAGRSGARRQTRATRDETCAGTDRRVEGRSSETSRGDAAAATWIFRGESRGRDVLGQVASNMRLEGDAKV